MNNCFWIYSANWIVSTRASSLHWGDRLLGSLLIIISLFQFDIWLFHNRFISVILFIDLTHFSTLTLTLENIALNWLSKHIDSRKDIDHIQLVAKSICPVNYIPKIIKTLDPLLQCKFCRSMLLSVVTETRNICWNTWTAIAYWRLI